MCERIVGLTPQRAERKEPSPSYLPSFETAIKAYRHEGLHNRGTELRLANDQAGLQRIFLEYGFVVPPLNTIEGYNPSLPLIYHGVEYIASRFEGRMPSSSKLQTLTIFLKHDGERWVPLPQPLFELEDFRISWVGGELIGAGVQTKPNPQHKGWVDYRMAFYRGRDINSLHHAFYGPWGMKGINIVELSNHQYGLYTRPQGVIGGAGQIGFTIVDSLIELQENALECIARAKLLSTRFPNDEWGGANHLVPTGDGRITIVGHRACRDRFDKRHYAPWACEHDPFTGEIKDLGILAERSDFPSGRAKAPDLVDVLYTVGLDRSGGQIRLITGISDTQAGEIVINPGKLFQKQVCQG